MAGKKIKKIDSIPLYCGGGGLVTTRPFLFFTSQPSPLQRLCEKKYSTGEEEKTAGGAHGSISRLTSVTALTLPMLRARPSVFPRLNVCSGAHRVASTISTKRRSESRKNCLIFLYIVSSSRVPGLTGGRALVGFRFRPPPCEDSPVFYFRARTVGRNLAPLAFMSAIAWTEVPGATPRIKSSMTTTE
jgi:hypothetical protein